MKVSVILGHPNKASFNHAIAIAAVQALQNNGHDVIFHDLHEERFDPILEHAEIGKGAALDPVIQKHCDEIVSADGIVIVHPDWWGQLPAVLKGWVDRVFRPGVTYEFAEIGGGLGKPVGRLKAQAALVFNTSNTPREMEIKVYGDPLETIWKNCIFKMCGVTNVYRNMYGPIVISTPEQRQAWLDEVREMVHRYFPGGS